MSSMVPTVLIGYFWVFGLYASFKLDRFGLALVMPPVAWFDALYFWFSPAEYEKHWDRNVELLGSMVLGTDDDIDKTGKVGIEAKEMLHEWIPSIPAEKRLALRRDLGLLGDTFVDGMLDAAKEKLYSGGTFTPPPIPRSLAGQPGLERLWKRWIGDIDTIMTAVASIQGIDDRQLKDELNGGIAKFQSMMQVVRDTLKRRITVRLDYWLK